MRLSFWKNKEGEEGGAEFFVKDAAAFSLMELNTL